MDLFIYLLGRLARSDRAFQHIRGLAERYSRTKFVSIVGNKCIPDLPDARIPMILVYRKGEVKQQFVSWGADRERRLEGMLFLSITSDFFETIFFFFGGGVELEAVLLLTGALDLPDRLPPKVNTARDDDDDGDSSEDGYGVPSTRKMRSAVTTTNAKSVKNVRSSGGRGKGDSDSEFEFDM